MAIRHRPLRAFTSEGMRPRRLRGISRGFPRLSPCGGAGSIRVTHSVRRSPAGARCRAPAAPRLACVRPVASVHPEPGSNSSLFIFYLLFFLLFLRFPGRAARGRHARRGPLSGLSLYLSLPGRRPRRPVRLQHHFNVLSQGPQGRLAKFNDYPPFFQTYAASFSAARASFPVCGCKGTTVPRSFPNFQATFFSSFFTPSAQDPVSHADAPETFFTKNCFKTCPTLNPPQFHLKW